MKVFLSHSSADKALARRLAADLRSAKVDVWLDQWEIRVGESFEQKIEQGLDEVEFVIVLLTPHSVESNWVDREWRQKFETEAHTERVAIVPLRGEACEIPDFLAQRSYADISGGSYPLGFRHLLEILRHYADESAIEIADVELVQDEASLPMLPVLTPIALEVGADLIPLFEPDAEGANRFLDELASDMRAALRAEFGFSFPGIRVRGNESDMPPRTALIMLEEVPELMLEVGPQDVFTEATADTLAGLGIRAEPIDPPVLSRFRARINAENRAAAAQAGIRSWDAVEYLVMALQDVIRRNATLFLDIDVAHTLVESFRVTAPELVDATVPAGISWIELTTLLQHLVAEGIGIGDMGRILEAVRQRGQDYREVRDTSRLSEQVRHALCRQITMQFTHGRDRLPVMMLAPEAERLIGASILQTEEGPYLQLDPEVTRKVLAAVRTQVDALGQAADAPPILLEDPQIRHYVRKLVCLEFPGLQELSRQDLDPDIDVRAVGAISLDPDRGKAMPGAGDLPQ